MNAGAPQKIRPMQEILQAVQNIQHEFDQKHVQPKKVEEFYDVILKTSESIHKKEYAATVKSNPELNQKCAEALQQLKNSIGRNKAVIETAVAGMPVQQLLTSIDTIHQYLKKEEADAKKVSRKDQEPLGKGA